MLVSHIYALWFVFSLVGSLVLRFVDSLVLLFVFPNSVIETEIRYGGQFGAKRKRSYIFKRSDKNKTSLPSDNFLKPRDLLTAFGKKVRPIGQTAGPPCLRFCSVFYPTPKANLSPDPDLQPRPAPHPPHPGCDGVATETAQSW